MSRFGARILLTFSRAAETPPALEHSDSEGEDALERMDQIFPDFSSAIQGKAVLDFGCGAGKQAISISRRGAARVVGLDTNRNALNAARALAGRTDPGGSVEFKDALAAEDTGAFDVVISQDAMEHYSDPESVLKQMRAALKPGGRLLITFGPPWLAPYGSHMQFFTAIPWVNILFSEDSVMRARSRFRDDGAMRYEDVESGLNRMTVGKFEKLLATQGLTIDFVRYDCVKGLNWLANIPRFRELFINQITISAKKTGHSPVEPDPGRVSSGVPDQR